MDRKSFASVLDEAVGQLDGQVRTLRNQQSTLIINIKELESTRDNLSNDILNLENKNKSIIKTHKENVDSMSVSVKEKLENVNKLEANLVSKISEYNVKTKEANDLIKSNQGLQKNIKEQESTLSNKVSKLEELFKKIKEV